MKDKVSETAVALPAGLVAAAEREILQELWDATEESDRAGAERGEDVSRHLRVAVVLLVICTAFTAFNLVRATRSRDVARQAHDTVVSIEFVAADLEAERGRTGEYPADFENPFDDPAWRYERVAPDRFRLVVAGPDDEFVYDSAQKQVRRVVTSAAPEGSR